MHGPHDFELVEFAEYLYDKRIVFLVSCGVAIGLTLAAGAFLPKQYTAKSSIMIGTPGNGPHATAALSPAYLESLKSWESLASSDSLYVRTAGRLRVNSSKASTLKVARLGNSTVIEISATLRNPVQAQALAQNIAEQTVEISRALEAKTAEGLASELKKQLQAAQERLTRAYQALAAFTSTTPLEAPENDMRSGFDFQLHLAQDLSAARTSLAEYEAQKNSPEASAARLAGFEARIAALEGQQRDLSVSLAKKGAQLDAAKSRRSALEDEQRSARSAYEDVRIKLNDALSSPEYNGTRLHIIDPGMVPRDASSPNIRLDVAAAFLASLVGTLAFLVVRFGYVRLQRERSEHLYSLR
ncbi:MAG TPA: hypothetical protein VHZ74_01225 [Bryobacteraceae bacterium]|nr:hypothetical protein [Bryobacteraceae bacterium]